MTRARRSRGSGEYRKPALSHEEQIRQWRRRGLKLPDEDRAARYLRHIGYYRLSPYTIPFQIQGTDHRFREGARFDDVLDLYVFDRKLRLLVLDALERVEVAVRASITDHMAVNRGGPHWYTDAELFSGSAQHRELMRMIRETCERQLVEKPESSTGTLFHRSALEHYLTTYGAPELPPSWLMIETLTIGQLSRLYRNLKNRSDRTAIAEVLGLTDPLLGSWLRAYVRVRNICAHHERLWNAGLGVLSTTLENWTVVTLEK
ncbi:Abi family protein [Aeromicrobium piscarium]|uniref:Abi family protein n=1 Tax=Aeromicrobium piscarium TaxID=2590901 RepID=A0A554RJJ1_9ACTN|nr:Abi family protein [Aeromicrobium piscarium]TSD54296.1 Abi family protein [Aeromicrobium piscarium]